MASSYECVVTNECIFELIDFFATRGTQYRANLTDRKVKRCRCSFYYFIIMFVIYLIQYEVVEKMCLHLLARDYYVQVCTQLCVSISYYISTVTVDYRQ